MNSALAVDVARLQRRVSVLEAVVGGPVFARAMRRIVERVAAEYAVSVPAMVSEVRSEPLALARHVAMALIRDIHCLSLPRIGRHFNRDHTSVLHALRRVAALRAADADFDAAYRWLHAALTPSQEAANGR